ncbi:hypothetical protein [Corynebacterium efficiens YS-314]|uniref:Uncharacterized protein n=1 Tax=Corynebacterium efficiens (strain DSM 44549 / YS-314 / AJ 12310 / JCM 11189 / NBRC 100395) TaxID=196164 RepID=Q8FNN7_COREF|nr:hypothetical protein [Corynebacterium efficiens YS-314]
MMLVDASAPSSRMPPEDSPGGAPAVSSRAPSAHPARRSNALAAMTVVLMVSTSPLSTATRGLPRAGDGVRTKGADT